MRTTEASADAASTTRGEIPRMWSRGDVVNAAQALPSSTPAPLEPATQRFRDGPAGAPPPHTLTPEAAHEVLTDLQLARQRAALARAAFLARASRVLGSSLERWAVLDATAQLAVPALASFAVVLALEDGRVSGAVAAHPDPEWERRLRDAAGQLERYPLPGHGRGEAGAHEALLGELRRHLPAELVPCPLACLPLTASGTVTGLLVLACPEPEREPDPAAPGLAEELAFRAGSALENARLFDAAVQATRARDDLMGIVAHDLRNPLNLVASAVEMIAGGAFAGKPEAERHHLGIIRRAAEQMNRLIADLLDANRIGTGSLAVEPRPDRADVLVAETLTLLGPLAEANGLCLSAHVADGLPPVCMDPGRVQQVLSNLIGNAIKFTPRGGTVRLSAVRDGGHLRVSVADSGPGIPPEHMPRLFDRFWQADSRGRGGIGLGLSIARAIVEAHAGRIWVESEMGAGTTFSFTLPLVQSDEHTLTR